MEEGHKSNKTKTKKENIVEELNKKLDESQEKYLRLYSEFDNYRKRTVKEKLELSNMASAEVISALLTVLDDLDRAVKSFSDNPDTLVSHEGISLIQAKMKRILESRGLREISAVGNTFDTDYHEAITNIPATSEDTKGMIIDEVEKGYLLNGKVIRFAKVIVAN